MIFKNINVVFPSVSVFFVFFLFSSFFCIQYTLLNVLFQLLNFLNSFKCLAQQINVTEVEVCSSVVKALPSPGCFTTCMGAHFPAVEMGNAFWFSIVSGPLKGIRVPVALFQMVPSVQPYPIIYVRA